MMVVLVCIIPFLFLWKTAIQSNVLGLVNCNILDGLTATMWLELKLQLLAFISKAALFVHSHNPIGWMSMPHLLTSRQEEKQKKNKTKKKKEVTAARQMRLLTLMSMSASLLFSAFRGRPGRLGMPPLDKSVVCSGGG